MQGLDNHHKKHYNNSWCAGIKCYAGLTDSQG